MKVVYYEKTTLKSASNLIVSKLIYILTQVMILTKISLILVKKMIGFRSINILYHHYRIQNIFKSLLIHSFILNQRLHLFIFCFIWIRKHSLIIFCSDKLYSIFDIWHTIITLDFWNPFFGLELIYQSLIYNIKWES